MSHSARRVRFTQLRILQRGLAVTVTVLVGLVAPGVASIPAAVGAPSPNPNYPIELFKPGERLQLPLWMYRYRHTILTKDDNNKDNTTGYGRNIADAWWQTTSDGHVIDWYLTAPSVSNRLGLSKVALVDIFQFDEGTGLWRLVDRSGNQLLGPDGKPVAWDKSSQPSLVLEVDKEDALKADLAGGRTHSEPLLRYVMTAKMDPKLGGADLPSAVIEVGSERMFCSGPPDCVNNLKRMLFPNVQRGVILTPLPSRSTLNAIAYPSKKNKDKVSNEEKEEAQRKLSAKQYSDAVIESSVQGWVSKGHPNGANTPAVMGGTDFGNSAAQGPAARVGTQGADPGGIDFTSLQLRYVSEDPGGTFRYAYSASPAGPGRPQDPAAGQLAMAQMAEAFYVWLNLPTSTFWVNLNPSEPDRIIDAKLATTDVGRILLQADLQMKKLAASLTNPNTDTGLQFWGPPNPDVGKQCTITRQWIVPKPASVHEANGGLYILDAPLQVKAEAEKFSGTQGDPSCPTPDARMEQVFERVILPKVEDAVNHAPEFTELRRVYLARVAAEWYRQRHTGALTSMIDSGDVHQWPPLQTWAPKQVFNAYVTSYRNHEYNVTKTLDRGDYRYTFTYSDGGVDFGDLPLSKVSNDQFQRQYPDVSKAVDQSLQAPAPDGHQRVWLGGTAKVKPQPLDYTAGRDDTDDDGVLPGWALSPGPSSGSTTVWMVLAVVLAVVTAVVVSVIIVRTARRRRVRHEGLASTRIH